MAHKLVIVIEDIQQDVNYIRAIDWSDYDKKMSITNRVMKVNVPGEEVFKLVPFPQGESISYSSKSLKISKTIEPLPDGLFTFTYSICPNERKFVIVNHFRTVALENTVMGVLAKVMGTCRGEGDVLNALVTCLLNIRSLKSNSIDEFNVDKAYDLYAQTEKLINNLYKTL